jgi:hypothetical protein
MKNSNDTIGNQTHDLPACRGMLQPTAPPSGPFIYERVLNNKATERK